MKDTNFVTNTTPLTSVNSTIIPNWVDGGQPLFYVPSRLLGMSWFMEAYKKSRAKFFEHFMECVKTRNWEYRTVENLVQIDWSVKPDGSRIKPRESY